MRDRIQEHVTLNAETSANVVIRFDRRDGTLKDLRRTAKRIDRLDIAAQRAILITPEISPLPAYLRVARRPSHF
jgi:hypothetical protein